MRKFALFFVGGVLCAAGWAQLRGQADEAAPAAAPLPLKLAVERINETLPEGFQATLFAGEPDVVQPIAAACDDRGRLWVVECLSYPAWTTDGTGHDRVVIFTDTDNDGEFDERKVFLDNGVNLSGIELGFGGVYLTSVPNLFYVPDRDRDDVPDGPAEVLLDGWDLTARHNAVNGLRWGPDGWLYGCNGILSNSRVGRPGTPDEERVLLNCGVWRFHPQRMTFEAVAHGTTNPWGVDFDDYGQMFITNCVIKHLFHLTPGGHYDRMFGQDVVPNVFGLIPSCADHIHWAGGYWDTEGVDKPENDEAGGGHAHCGALIYVGDNWPAEYRNTLLTCNIHGHRVNCDSLERTGSGYVATHRPDVFKAQDEFFRGVAVVAGLDGAVYVLDWCDSGECHDYEEVQRENGRIYRITYGQPTPTPADLAALNDDELAALQLHENDYLVRKARLLLQERAATGTVAPSAVKRLRQVLARPQVVTHSLRALWALHAIGALSEQQLLGTLNDPAAELRGWAVRLLTESLPVSSATAEALAAVAENEQSPAVRLELAAALQRLEIADRAALARPLLAHAEDAEDANLPWMLWYGLEQLVGEQPEQAVALVEAAAIPLVRQCIAQRLVLADRIDLAAGLLSDDHGAAVEKDAITGMQRALEGRRGLAPPENWREVASRIAASGDSELILAVLRLSLVFGQREAVSPLRRWVQDAQRPSEERTAALQTLVEFQDDRLAELLLPLLDDAHFRGPAIRGLGATSDDRVPEALLSRYGDLNATERGDVVATLAERGAWAKQLLLAIQQGEVPRGDLSPFVARQLLAQNDAELAALLTEVWGELRPVSETKVELAAELRGQLTSDVLTASDRSAGRAVFRRQCGNCHKLFGDGGQIGPELTGSQRTHLEYLLENLLDPSAVVPRDYQVTFFQLDDGRTLSGIVKAETPQSVTVQTPQERLILPAEIIEERQPSTLSMMPEGLLTNLSPREVQDLFAYLMGPTQAPLPDAQR